MERRDKWVHVDNVKRFRGSENSTDFRPEETQVVLIPADGTNGEEQQQLQSPESVEGELEEQDVYANVQTDHSRASQTFGDRYPQRNRRPPRRFEDYVSWDLCPETAETSDNPNPSYLPP